MSIDRKRGCLLGLVIGDALGAAVEFKPPGSFQPVVGYRAGGPHGLDPGEWTDDTSMALALADSIAKVGWDLDDQASRYVSWWRTGAHSVNGQCFDIGITTRTALARFERTGDGRSSGSPAESASGNGSIMRLAPVPIRYADLFPDSIVELGRLAAESSLTTHASPQCLSACRYLALVLAGLIQGVDRSEVLSPTWEPLQRLRTCGALHPEVDAVAAGSFRELAPPSIKGSGYVVQSLEAALWAFHDANSFEEAVLRAVNLGDDADTTGAVCGQIAGAYWGEAGIADALLDGLAKREMIEEALDGLISTFSPVSPATTSPIHPESRPAKLAPRPVRVDRLPARPEFLTSNWRNKTENEAMVDRVWKLAASGDLAGLRTLSLSPSPKLKNWHAAVVGEIERQLAVSESTVPPTSSSYWVIPGRLLAGAYPGAADPVDHRQKVNDLLDAGVRAFVNLMEEDETNHAGRTFTPYEDLAQSLATETSFHRFAIKDLSVPDAGTMSHILETIDRLLAENRTVYVHCWGGVGRTGTVIACWLLQKGLATPDDVLNELQKLRRQDKERGSRQSPETADQRDYIFSWSSARPISIPAAGIPLAIASDDFQPTPAAAEALRELLDRFKHMNGFTDGPCGKNQLTATESALFAATYEIRQLLGRVDSGEHSHRLIKLYDLLVDGVLRSIILSRGGFDWVEADTEPTEPR